MLTRFAQGVVRRRRAVLIGALLAVVAAFAYGGKVADQAEQRRVHRPGIAVVAGRCHPRLPVPHRQRQPGAARHRPHRHRRLPGGRRRGQSPHRPAGRRRRSGRRRLLLVVGERGPAALGRRSPSADLRPAHRHRRPGQHARPPAHSRPGRHPRPRRRRRATGQAAVFRQLGDTVTKDLGKAEGIAIPITLVLLVFVFGSLVAACAAPRRRR